MPKNKDAFSRYKTIDKTLRNWRPIKSKKLAEICSEKLGKPVSVRQIQKDIEDMNEDTSLEINASIKYDTKLKSYYYEKDTPPILFPPIELSTEEITALLFYIKASSHYNDLKIFKGISQAIEKVLSLTNIPGDLKNAFRSDSIIETERILPVKGSELIYKLLHAVRERRVITFDYKPFEATEARARKVKPVLLKEDKHMWYIIAFEENGASRTFALDRMQNLKLSDETFAPIDFNSAEYFKYSLGITVPDETPVKIVLKFSKGQANYIKALKIHETQAIEHEDSDGVQISITVRPSYELYSKLLSYGETVKVVSPPIIADRIKQHHSQALKNY